MGLKDGFGLNGGGNGGGGGVPYKSYVALLQLDLSNNIVADVVQNELGATISYTTVGVGTYKITASSPVFTLNKTTFHPFIYSDETGATITGGDTPITTTEVYFNTTDAGGGTGSSLIKPGTSVEIRVYQ